MICIFLLIFFVIFQIFHSAHVFPMNNYFKSFSTVNSGCTIVQCPNALSLLPVSFPFSPSLMLLDEFFKVQVPFMEIPFYRLPIMQRSRSKHVSMSYKGRTASLLSLFFQPHPLQFLTNMETFPPLHEEAMNCGILSKAVFFDRNVLFPLCCQVK